MLKNKRLKGFVGFIVSLAVIAAVVAIPPIHTQAATTNLGYVNGISVNLRADAGTGYASLGKLTYVQVEIIGCKTGTDGKEWKKIRYGTLEGYMRGDYVSSFSVNTASDSAFEEKIKAFPESYRAGLRLLHSIYPNWTFEADAMPDSFDTAIKAESVFPNKLVPESYSVSLRSMGENAYNWSNGTWYTTSGSWVGASREIIAYYMDPRNFLNPNSVYMFADQSYNKSTQTADGVKQIVKGTFLEKGFSDTSDYGGSYINIIMAAAEQTGVSPYMLASIIKQEQGVNGTSDLISGKYSGYVGYYNFLNFGATGTTNTDVIVNGLEYAKKKEWNSRSKSIIGGAAQLAGSYFSKGQSTYYYKNFDVKSGNYSFQYAQNIYDSANSCSGLREIYIGDTSSKLHFVIPVYKEMWENPAPKPAENNKKNNYYFTSLGVSGFSMYKQEYSLNVSGHSNIPYKVPSGASYAGPEVFSLNKGKNTLKLTVKAETGATNVYTLTVTAATDCLLAIGDTMPKPPIVIPDAPQVLFVKGNTVALVGVSGQEYSMDNVNWQSYNVFENVQLNTVIKFYCRTSEEEVSDPTQVMIVSAPKLLLVGATKAKFEANEGFLYSVDAFNWQSDAVLTQLEPNREYTVYQRPANSQNIYVVNQGGTEFVTNGEDEFNGEYNAVNLAKLRFALMNGSISMADDFTTDDNVDIRDLVMFKKILCGVN